MGGVDNMGGTDNMGDNENMGLAPHATVDVPPGLFVSAVWFSYLLLGFS